MNKDIRLNLSFSDHRKRKKLFALLGAQGVLSLIDLWLKTAENRPKGSLTGMNETDIAFDAQWPGEPKRFCDVLCEVGFMDRAEDGTYSIHDWKEHQGFAFFAEERSQQAKEAATSRWSKGKGRKKIEKKETDANHMRPACDPHTKGNAPSPSPSPSPNPNPNPIPNPYPSPKDIRENKKPPGGVCHPSSLPPQHAGNDLDDFIRDCCEVGSTKIAKSGDLCSAHKVWAKQHQKQMMSDNAFYLKLRDRGFKKEKDHQFMVRRGIGLKVEIQKKFSTDKCWTCHPGPRDCSYCEEFKLKRSNPGGNL